MEILSFNQPSITLRTCFFSLAFVLFSAHRLSRYERKVCLLLLVLRLLLLFLQIIGVSFLNGSFSFICRFVPKRFNDLCDFMAMYVVCYFVSFFACFSQICRCYWFRSINRFLIEWALRNHWKIIAIIHFTFKRRKLEFRWIRSTSESLTCDWLENKGNRNYLLNKLFDIRYVVAVENVYLLIHIHACVCVHKSERQRLWSKSND